MDIWTVVLSSSIVSGLVSALIGGWFNLRTKHIEYANAYYKMVLKRRLAAYEEVEKLIGTIKVAVVDFDQRPYHMLFSQDDDQLNVYRQFLGTMTNSLWLTDDLYKLTRQLNHLVYSRANEKVGLIEFGKQNYTAVAELRTKLEKMHTHDMLTLHDVPAFLAAKKPTDSYGPLPPRG